MLNSAAVCFFISFIFAVLEVLFQKGFGSTDLYAFAIYTVPFAVLTGIISPATRKFKNFGIRSVIALCLGFLWCLGWTYMVRIFLGPWFGAWSISVFLCWLAGAGLALMLQNIHNRYLKPLRFSFQVLLFGFVVVLGSTVASYCQKAPTIKFMFPSNYEGLFLVYEDKMNGQNSRPKNDEVILYVPKSGRLPVKSDKVFESWHRIEGKINDGPALSMEYNPLASTSLIEMFTMQGKGTYFFVGSYQDYKRLTKMVDISKLPLGTKINFPD